MSPSWDRLYALAEAQDGHFTTSQACEAGYSPQLLAKYLKSGRVVRLLRGVYRLVHFPSGDHEDLVTLWLWADQQAVFSHDTALLLHGLSDALPATTHLSVPTAWRQRRLRVPHARVVLHYADVEPRARAWSGSVPVTTPSRTVSDCAKASVAPDLVEQAAREGLRRGLFRIDEIGAATEYLARFDRRLT